MPQDDRRIAYAAGIPRSGSTLVRQIMDEVLPEWRVVSRHPAELGDVGGAPVVMTYRDPLDVAASRYRVRLSRDGLREGSAVDMLAEIDVMRQHVDAFMAMSGDNIMKLRYESFWNNYDAIFDALELLFGIVIESHDRNALRRSYSLSANRTRAEALRDFNDVDATGIHGAHVATPEPGGWRSLPMWAQEIALKSTMPYRAVLGYA